MKLGNLIAYAIAATIIAGCGCKSGEIAHHDLTSNVLIGEDAASLGAVYTINMLDSSIVIGDWQCDSLFHVFNRHNLEYIGRFGRIGQGPGEFLSYTTISTKDGHTIGLLDVNRKRYVEADIDISRIPTVRYSGEYDLSDSPGIVLYPVTVGNYITVALNIEVLDRHPFVLINPELETICRFGEYPCRERERSWPKEAIAQGYSPLIAVSPNGRNMAAMTGGAEIASFYNVMSDTVVLAAEFRNIYPALSYDDGEYCVRIADSMQRFCNIAASDNRVFILYSDLSCSENPFTFETGNRVLVYDWDGRQVEELHLDRRIGAFAVDQDEHRLYGVTIDGSDPEIIYFDLPQ